MTTPIHVLRVCSNFTEIDNRTSDETMRFLTESSQFLRLDSFVRFLAVSVFFVFAQRFFFLVLISFIF